MAENFDFLTFQLIEKLASFNLRKPEPHKIKRYFQLSFGPKLSDLLEEDQIISALLTYTRHNYDPPRPLIALAVRLFEHMMNFATQHISEKQLMGFIIDRFCDQFVSINKVQEIFFFEIVSCVKFELACTLESIKLKQSKQDHGEKKKKQRHDQIQRQTEEINRLTEIITRARNMAFEYPAEIKFLIQPIIQALSSIDD